MLLFWVGWWLAKSLGLCAVRGGWRLVGRKSESIKDRGENPARLLAVVNRQSTGLLHMWEVVCCLGRYPNVLALLPSLFLSNRPRQDDRKERYICTAHLSVTSNTSQEPTSLSYHTTKSLENFLFLLHSLPSLQSKGGFLPLFFLTSSLRRSETVAFYNGWVFASFEERKGDFFFSFWLSGTWGSKGVNNDGIKYIDLVCILVLNGESWRRG